jgi:hypothetical protein
MNSIGILITCVVLSLLPGASQSQSRRRLSAPPALLEILDKEDRNCVVMDGLNKSVDVQAIQLAADGSRQILVRGSGLCLCGAQNCLFRKIRAGQKSLKGYRDVITESHASAYETILRTYRYDGSQYQLERCVSRAYYEDNGKYPTRPTYRPC